MTHDVLDHDRHVTDQFGPQANAYLRSAVHAAGADLDAIAGAVRRHRPARVLDLGCGGGHVTYVVAPLARSVVACDLSAAMLDEVAAEATRRGLANVETQQASAERLPFADGSFDALVSRYSAHHWGDVAAGIVEARRVLRPGGLAIFGDVVAPESALLDTILQSLELLRDPSHVRDYSVAQWHGLLREAGFGAVVVERRRLRLDFASWIERMRTPEPLVAAIRHLQAGFAEPVRQAFEVEADGSFTVDTATIESTVPF